MIRVRFELTTHGLEDRCSIQLSYQTIALTRTLTIIEKSFANCNHKINFLIMGQKIMNSEV